jgi:hypothetical protein
MADAMREEDQRRERDQPDAGDEEEQCQCEPAPQVARLDGIDALPRPTELVGDSR